MLVDEESQKAFDYRVRQVLMSSGNTTFTKVANKWNNCILGLVTYFREAVINTLPLLDIIVKCENKIQNRIKMGLNSKMPSRFPPVVFYTPKELGGLGMISMGHILIPVSDTNIVDQHTATHFRNGMTHTEDKEIPILLRYISSWFVEFEESKRVWAEYAEQKNKALSNGTRIQLEDCEDKWDKGIPRINTLFQKDMNTLNYDKGWRMRQFFKQYTIMKTNSLWWTHSRHDGKLWNLQNYRTDVIQALGGVEAILEHTLFKGTAFRTWEGLFWEKSSGFEESMRAKTLTNAQRSGLNQIPNRRFTLWWSPTINRANVYIGFQVQLDLTGIFMHGKIPTLKVSLVQLFRGHLWQKIHESVVTDILQVFDQKIDELGIESVEKVTIHPRKSYKMNSSANDIILAANYQWGVSKPSLLFDPIEDCNHTTTTKYWFDVQLRWGDYDSHDIERYCRQKFLDYVSDPNSNYVSNTGVLLGIDLAYNQYSGYGHWIPGSKELVQRAMAKIMESNPALGVLRDRIRTGLQLYSSEPTEQLLSSDNYMTLFSDQTTWFVDDTNVYKVIVQKTVEGNTKTRPINGCLLLFDARTGKLHAHIVHAKTWANQHRLAQLSKWKSAEFVTSILKGLNKEEQPKELIVIRKGLNDPLSQYLIDFPNIVIRGTELELPLNEIIRNEKISNAIYSATENCTQVYNLYDDWGERGSPYQCFLRLILILRGMHVRVDQTNNILRPNAKVKVAPNHLWPTLTDQEWTDVETQLTNMIIGDFCKKNNVSADNLTQNDISNIMLGAKIEPPSQQEQQKAELDKQTNDLALRTAVTTNTTDVYGNKMQGTTFSPYEQQVFSSRTDWRIRALSISQIHMRLSYVHVVGVDESKVTYVLPKNLLNKFICISDLRSQICGYMYGKNSPNNSDVKEIRYIVLVPQRGDSNKIDVPFDLPESEVLKDMIPLGWIHTQPKEYSQLLQQDLFMHTRIMKRHKEWTSSDTAIITCSFTPGSINLAGFKITAKGFEWADKNDTPEVTTEMNFAQPDHYMKVNIINTNNFLGGFLVPTDEMWNYGLQGHMFRPDMKYDVSLNVPKDYFNEVCVSLLLLCE